MRLAALLGQFKASPLSPDAWPGSRLSLLGVHCIQGALNPRLCPCAPSTGYLPNSAHAVEAMLAAASIGAIWSSTSPDFGVNVSWGPCWGSAAA